MFLSPFIDPPDISLSSDHDIERNVFIVTAKIDTKWPILKANWKKDRNDLPLGENVVAEVPDTRSRKLRIMNCRKLDEGWYKLIVESATGRGESPEVELRIPDGM